jgi:hypothetical protein
VLPGIPVSAGAIQLACGYQGIQMPASENRQVVFEENHGILERTRVSSIQSVFLWPDGEDTGKTSSFDVSPLLGLLQPLGSRADLTDNSKKAS